ncbi:hypothetical protein [Microbacterium sp. zg-YB36]|nr:hypothetical protein [Microbacterium sp. zg-YB36]MDL5351180.1 hypothetical protein [Microbacterium sp. zg-YB36]
MSEREVRDERWYDMPGVAGLLGGAIFTVVLVGGHCLLTWLIHGEVTW